MTPNVQFYLFYAIFLAKTSFFFILIEFLTSGNQSFVLSHKPRFQGLNLKHKKRMAALITYHHLHPTLIPILIHSPLPRH